MNMNSYNVIAQTNESTVVEEYIPLKKRSESYQSEADLEQEFIKMLVEQGYEYCQINCEKDLISNLRVQLERLNDLQFTDGEWERFFNTMIANSNEGIEEKTRTIQEDNIKSLERDDGSIKNITIIDKKNIHNNKLQVINQYVVNKEDGAVQDNRYDVTILVNGLPLVHVELKRRGVQIREAFNQINRYERESFFTGSGLFNYVQLFVISNGTNTKYYSNTTRYNSVKEQSKSKNKKKTSNSFEFTSFWADAKNKIIPDLVDFTRTFFQRNTILSILTRYCIFTSDNILMVMRPYQITATERILQTIERANNYKQWGTARKTLSQRREMPQGGGYIWHTTGSGKTLTSFKTTRLATELPYIDKVLFVVDRKDLDYQTMKEYDKFEKGCANSNSSANILTKQLEASDGKIIITTIQKLSTFIKKNPNHPVFDKHVVMIFDECHRSQFGQMHTDIISHFKKYHIFGFTGTPIFTENIGSATLSPEVLKDDGQLSIKSKDVSQFLTTEQLFGKCLHSYTIINAIADNNVLPFHVDYVATVKEAEDIQDEKVTDIEREKVLKSPERAACITKYILDHFNQKTYRTSGCEAFNIRVSTNVQAVASAGRGKIEDIKENRTVVGFNSIFAVASVPMAKIYYNEFKKQMAKEGALKLKIATIFSYAPNEEEILGSLQEENSEDTTSLDKSSREFLEVAISDYNHMFKTNYDTSSDKFQNYYKDVAMRMKNREIDLLIVVNMFLTGFDATTLNTLWVDKNLKMHGLIQAFSRTNRILNKVKTFGNIVCFRNLQKNVEEAIARFGNTETQSRGVVLLKTFGDYFYGFTDENGNYHQGYKEIVEKLLDVYPIKDELLGTNAMKDFVNLYGTFLRMRNLLLSFDQFREHELLKPIEIQDYTSKYLDIKDKLRNTKDDGQVVCDIVDDLVFETELISTMDINIDYILMLIKQYKSRQGKDKELLVNIQSAVKSSPELRSKLELIESFIANINENKGEVETQWLDYVDKKRDEDIGKIIVDEKLKPNETIDYLNNCFEAGEVNIYGTDIVKILPKMSRFGSSGTNRNAKKKEVIKKIENFFEKFYSISANIPFVSKEH